MSASDAEEALAWQMRAAKVAEPRREYRFMSDRMFRFDFAWPDLRVAVEVEGGQWVGGRHNNPTTFEAELTKYNYAALFAWSVIRVTPRMVESGEALNVIERMLKVRTVSAGGLP